MAGQRRRVAVILGAGASKDVAGRSPKVSPFDWTPPLAGELFSNPGNFRHVELILQKYPGAVTVRQLVMARTDGSSIQIEDELRRLSRNELYASAYKHVPPYLRDYLYAVSHSHVTSPGNLIQLVADLMDSDHEVAFVVLNYDTFLEQAIEGMQWNVKFDSIDAYMNTGLPIQVFKVHGSVNWAVLMDARVGDWAEAVEGYDLRLDNREIVIFGPHDTIQDVNEAFQWYYPVLTAPLAEKSGSDLVCPPMHTEALNDFLSGCRKYLVLGTSGLDNDLLAQLAAHAAEPEIVHYVCGDGSQDARDNFERAIPRFRSLEPTSRHDPNLRFGEYIGSVDFRNFLARSGPKPGQGE